MKLKRYLRFQLAWWKWWLESPPAYSLENHVIIETLEERRSILVKNWEEREPKRKDFSL